MNKITLQQIFDAAFQAFIIEDRPPCVGPHGGCLYDDNKGNACAIGLVIPPEIIKDVDGTFGSVIAKYSDYFSEKITDLTFQELDLFQCCLHDSLTKHDGIKNINKWAMPVIQRLEIYKLVAKAYNLTVPPYTTAYGKVLSK